MNYIDTNLPNIIEAKDIHKNKLLPIIRDRKNVCPNANIVNFLTDEIIEKILISKPKQIHQLNLLFLRKTIVNFSLADFSEYFENKRKKKRTIAQQNQVDKYKTIFNLIEEIFDYEAFSKKSNNYYSAYDLSQKLDIPTCPYCNRMYTKTVVKPSKITRPALVFEK